MTPEAVGRVVLRLAFGIGELVAPRMAARRAARMWFTVPARRSPVLPEPTGATVFTVSAPTGDVRGRSWGEGPAVYFMHGWGGDSGQVHAFVEPLLAAGMRVVTLDAPGHGTSAPQRRTHAVEFARALEAVQRSQGCADVVIAHSLGGVALMESIRSTGIAPDRLVLLAPLARLDGQLDRLGGLLGLGARTRTALLSQVAATTGLSVGELALADLTRRFPGREAVVVHDRDDSFAPYDETAALVAGWPDARLVTTRGLGHVRLLTDAAVVAVAVAGATQLPVAAARRPELPPVAI